MIKNIIKNKSGHSATILIVLLPGVLALFGLVFDLGRLYYFRLSHQGYSRSAAEAGITVVGDEMKAIIQEKIDRAREKGTTYEVLSPVWRNLNSKDILRLTSSSTASRTRSMANSYLNRNISENDKMLPAQNVQIIYPYLSGRNVSIRVEYQIQVPMLLMGYLPDTESTSRNRVITVQNEATMRIKD